MNSALNIAVSKIQPQIGQQDGFRTHSLARITNNPQIQLKDNLVLFGKRILFLKARKIFEMGKVKCGSIYQFSYFNTIKIPGRNGKFLTKASPIRRFCKKVYLMVNFYPAFHP